MKKLKLFAALTLVLSSAALWAQFPGGGGGFGGGRGGYGGGRPGEQGPQRQNTQNINRQLGGEEQENGPKIGTVSGTVIDDKNIPVEYATISIKDNATKKVVTGGISNMKGNFNIKQIPAGKYTVEVSFMGYKTFVSPVFELSQSQKSMNIGKIVLAENADMLDEVVIQGEVTTIENRIDKKIVNVGKDLMTAGASTRDVFENLPMVDVDFDGEVSLQGSSVRVLLDNRPTNMSVTDLIESLPADAIDKIELITNPSAKQDPDGVGGIINIITKKGVLYGLNFNARVGVDSKNRWNGGVNFGYYYGKLAFFANYNFRYSERDNTGETYRANYRPTTLNPNPYLNYQINGGGNSSVSHSLRTGINYLPNKKTSLSYTFGYRPNNSDSDTESSSYFLPLGVPMSEMSKEIAQQIVAEYSESLDDYFNRYRNSVSASKNSTITNSLNFRRDYSNYENLEVDVNYELSDQNSTSTILNTVANSNGRLTTNDFSATVFIVIFGSFDNLRPSHIIDGKPVTVDMASIIEILMLSAAALILLFTKANGIKAAQGSVFSAGMQAVVAIFGIAWMGDTFLQGNMTELKGSIEGIVTQMPWLFGIALFIMSILLYSQAATVRAFMPLGIALGISPFLLIAMFPAVNGYFFIPNYPTVVAAINFDRTGTTRIGKYVLNHSFMMPGLIATITSVVTGLILVQFIF